MRVKCDQCGEYTKKRPSQIRSWNNHFCSNKCRLEYRKEHPNRNTKHSFECQQKLKMLAEIRKSK